MERVTLRLPEEQVRRLEMLVQAGYNPNRAEGVRDAINVYLDEIPRDEEGVDLLVNAYLEGDLPFGELADVYWRRKGTRDKRKAE